jgi:hypothetical protein
MNTTTKDRMYADKAIRGKRSAHELNDKVVTLALPDGEMLPIIRGSVGVKIGSGAVGVVWYVMQGKALVRIDGYGFVAVDPAHLTVMEG